MPLLTRLYGSESFGIFAVYYSIANIAGIPSNLRFDLTIPIAENDEESAVLSSLSFVLALITGLLVGMIFFIPAARDLFKTMPQGYMVWILTSVSIVLIGWIQVFAQRLMRNGRLKYLSARHIVERLGFVIFALIAFNFGLSLTGLIWAQTLALFLSLLAIVFGARWKFQFSLKQTLIVMKKYGDFPRKNVASTALQLLTSQLPMIIYSRFFSASELGYLSLSQRLIDTPNSLIMSSLNVVYYRRLLVATRTHYQRIFLRSVSLGILAFGLPCLLAAVVAGPVFTWLFGVNWLPSSVFFVALLPLAFTRLMYSIHQSYLLIMRKLSVDLYLSGALFAAQLLGIFVGVHYSSQLLTPVLVSSNLAALVFGLGLIIIFKVVRSESSKES